MTLAAKAETRGINSFTFASIAIPQPFTAMYAAVVMKSNDTFFVIV